MSKIGRIIEFIGFAITWIGGAALAAIFLIVLVNGTWPHFLLPIQTRFAIISDFLGSLAFIVELFVFIGPGLLIAMLGQKLKE